MCETSRIGGIPCIRSAVFISLPQDRAVHDLYEMVHDALLSLAAQPRVRQLGVVDGVEASPPAVEVHMLVSAANFGPVSRIDMMWAIVATTATFHHVMSDN